MSDARYNSTRLEDLLADQALFGLTAEERLELQQLLADSGEEREDFDRIAALAALALHANGDELLPLQLQQKILAASEAHLPVARSQQQSAPSTSVILPSPLKSAGAWSRREVGAWLITTATLIALALLWAGGPLRPRREVSAFESRSELLQSAPDLLQTEWTATEDPTARGVSGDVVWSNRLQRGFLRFKGLAQNQVGQNQYQLWIFDSQQDDRYPIDGGVFDIDSTSGDVVVPIHAKLQVADPQMFAITIEKPGGVVVSSRERLILIAKPTGKSAG